MHRFRNLSLSLIFSVVLSGLCWSQDADAPYPVRMERQTREENVCMLVQKDGRYRLERTATGGGRVFIGTLDSSAVKELEPLLTATQLVELKQSQIESTGAGQDIDQVMITITRATGRQTLTFANPRSRKPFKGELDPILRWLDRNKQQQNPADVSPNRCMPPQMAKAGEANANVSSPSNPYMMRIVADRYEAAGGAAFSTGRGTGTESTAAFNTTPTVDANRFKITRSCAVVYESGRYRFERSVREAGILTKTEVYRDTLDKAQLAGLRGALDNPKLAALPNNSAPGYFAREGELISMAVPRDRGVQSIVVASFAPRPASADLQETAYTALMANLGLTNPTRKWLKQDIEERKSGLVKDATLTNCIPSPQPE